MAGHLFVATMFALVCFISYRWWVDLGRDEWRNLFS